MAALRPFGQKYASVVDRLFHAVSRGFRPAFFGVLRFQGAAQHVLSVRMCATGKALLYQRLKIGLLIHRDRGRGLGA
jgi:hypothetical protein